MDKSTILLELDHSFRNLEKLLLNFPPADFNRQPTETGWSARQIAEHLLLLEKVALQALRGTTVATNRPADSKISLIKWAMEDGTKREAPEIVQPSGENANPNEIATALNEERSKLKEAIASSDITEACTGVKHPALGTLTRLEWIYFTIYHTERHCRQIENLKERLTENIR